MTIVCPLMKQNVSAATAAVRLFPSTKGWFRASEYMSAAAYI